MEDARRPEIEQYHDVMDLYAMSCLSLGTDNPASQELQRQIDLLKEQLWQKLVTTDPEIDSKLATWKLLKESSIIDQEILVASISESLGEENSALLQIIHPELFASEEEVQQQIVEDTVAGPAPVETIEQDESVFSQQQPIVEDAGTSPEAVKTVEIEIEEPVGPQHVDEEPDVEIAINEAVKPQQIDEEPAVETEKTERPVIIHAVPADREDYQIMISVDGRQISISADETLLLTALSDTSFNEGNPVFRAERIGELPMIKNRLKTNRISSLYRSLEAATEELAIAPIVVHPETDQHKKRSRRYQLAEGVRLIYEIAIDRSADRIFIAGRELQAKPRELSFLKALIEEHPRAVDKQNLGYILGLERGEYVDPRSIDGPVKVLKGSSVMPEARQMIISNPDGTYQLINAQIIDITPAQPRPEDVQTEEIKAEEPEEPESPYPSYYAIAMMMEHIDDMCRRIGIKPPEKDVLEQIYQLAEQEGIPIFDDNEKIRLRNAAFDRLTQILEDDDKIRELVDTLGINSPLFSVFLYLCCSDQPEILRRAAKGAIRVQITDQPTYREFARYFIHIDAVDEHGNPIENGHGQEEGGKACPRESKTTPPTRDDVVEAEEPTAMVQPSADSGIDSAQKPIQPTVATSTEPEIPKEKVEGRRQKKTPLERLNELCPTLEDTIKRCILDLSSGGYLGEGQILTHRQIALAFSIREGEMRKHAVDNGNVETTAITNRGFKTDARNALMIALFCRERKLQEIWKNNKKLQKIAEGIIETMWNDRQRIIDEANQSDTQP